ncbi:MAG TPA: ABC transporter permease [Anaerolineae bacterium]|nr:ABC transporter permease [Anaerolineae bacterium]
MGRNVGAMVGIAILLSISFVAIFAPQIATHDPLEIKVLEEKFLPPQRSHLFGTDNLGRDIFSRVVFGTRISFRVAVTVLTIACSIGVVLGTISGYCGGLIDELIMRVADVFLAFPSFLLAMAIVAALGPGIENAILAVAIASWPRYARLVRGQVLTVKNLAYVEAARAIGASSLRIIAVHILPNCFAPLVVQATMDAGTAILTAAGLSFVGLGARPPTPEWGAMIARGRPYILTYWWVPTFPGLAISLTVAGYIFLGDGLRDLLDPRLRRVIGF